MTSPSSRSLEDLRAAVERDADRLVEELFAGFEVCEPLEAESAEPREAELLAPGPLVLREPEEFLRESEALALLPNSSTAVPASWNVNSEARRSWERWFFLGAVICLLGSLTWFWRRELNLVPATVSLPEPTAEKVVASQERQEFIAYLEQTLAAIARDERHAQQLAEAKAERERVEAVERARLDREQREQSQRELTRLKRELAQQEVLSASAPALPSTPLPPPPKVSVPLVPPPPFVIPKTIAPPAPTAPASVPQPPQPPEPPQPIAARSESAPPALSLEVLGSLEIGTRSLALIEVNGKTERVTTGETIPGTSWSVVKIAPRQVVLRDRAGRERTVPVGSQF
ncbi:MAG: hypothetical protein AAFY11_10365 [Cyanobacteria bacterium J06641_5]